MEKFEINGNKYTVLEPSEMNVLRNNALAFSIESLKWRVDPRDLDAFIVEILKDINASKIDQAKFKLQYLQELRKLDIAYNPTIDAVCHFVLLNDEPIDKIESEYYIKKKLLVEKDDQIRDFFLSLGIAFLKGTKIISDTFKESDYLKALKIAKANEDYLKEKLTLQLTDKKN